MRAALLILVVLALAGCGATKTVTVTNTVTHVRTVTITTTRTGTTTTPLAASAPCAAGSLQGSFDVVPGSPGAGQISYTLTLTNTGATACYVAGIPQVQLLGTTGTALPTAPSAEPPVSVNPPKVSLQHGQSAAAEARFSPDVNGTGDNAPGQCQPTATVLRVTAPGGGTLDAPIQPPTPVCERGSLHFRVFTIAP
ncbi:MAG TPA: DUF4232 domain-containing protein [Gaiellaceae bacterium]